MLRLSTIGTVAGARQTVRPLRWGAAVGMRACYLTIGLAAVLMPVEVMLASPAIADCTSSGAATVCAQGDVRGSSGGPVSGPVYPSYCADPWYCDDDWDMDIYLNPRPPVGINPNPPGGIDIGRPGRPGGGRR